MDAAPDTTTVKQYLLNLQSQIVSELERIDGQPFQTDAWERPQGGGGISRVLENGRILERAGVNFSHVTGNQLPPSATANRPDLAGATFEAMGVSLVFHPRNPFVPTVHMNVRFFIAQAHNQAPVWWFGGGMDLTPYYPFEEDVIAFHQTCKQAVTPFGDTLYRRFKRWCDEYFYLKHRQEPRGVGGLFFDDFSELGFEQSFALTRSVGNHFLPAYTPILINRWQTPYTEQHRAFQAYRRGRYVEFNLVFDRGTLFGLQSGGRTESILMSLPPVVNWAYNWKPEPNSPEDNLYRHFLIHKEWV